MMTPTKEEPNRELWISAAPEKAIIKQLVTWLNQQKSFSASFAKWFQSHNVPLLSIIGENVTSISSIYHQRIANLAAWPLHPLFRSPFSSELLIFQPTYRYLVYFWLTNRQFPFMRLRSRWIDMTKPAKHIIMAKIHKNCLALLIWIWEDSLGPYSQSINKSTKQCAILIRMLTYSNERTWITQLNFHENYVFMLLTRRIICSMESTCRKS